MTAAPKGLIIAAPRSGAGKTTVTLGLLRALRNRRTTVQPFKCGPDYIDPAFHTAAAGRTSVNLDTWAMRSSIISALITQSTEGADISIVEGVMGLFDGVGAQGQCGRGSTADLASLTGWPVVLVLDVASQAETAAAVALGCKTYRSDINLAGVILNRVASDRHERLVSDALAHINIPVLGTLRRRTGLALPERHLGLVQAEENDMLDGHLDALANAIEASVALDDVIACASPVNNITTASTGHSRLPPPGQRIALARDRAFSFVYPHMLSAWRAAGAEILPFSPIAGEAPDTSADAIWLPGGYPELHAPALANAQQFRDGMTSAADRGIAIHGECGGYMVLGKSLADANNDSHRMLGLLGVETSFAHRKLHLGYRRARAIERNANGNNIDLFGHEFHYATVISNPDDPLCDVRDAAGNAVPERGSRRGSITGTFFHLIDIGEAAA